MQPLVLGRQFVAFKIYAKQDTLVHSLEQFLGRLAEGVTMFGGKVETGKEVMSYEVDKDYDEQRGKELYEVAALDIPFFVQSVHSTKE